MQFFCNLYMTTTTTTNFIYGPAFHIFFSIHDIFFGSHQPKNILQLLLFMCNLMFDLYYQIVNL